MKGIDEKGFEIFLKKFISHPVTDTQWELFKKVSDIAKKCPPDCEVKWRYGINQYGVVYYYPEYVKKGDKSECNR